MPPWQFVVVLDGWPGDDLVDALFRRCADAAVWRDPGRRRVEVAFDRDAPTLVDAIVAAIRDLDAAGLPIRHVREDDDLVTLSIIAERAGRGREATRLWALGRSGPPGFPDGVLAHVSAPLYPWSRVAPWLTDRLRVRLVDHDAEFTAVNLALQLRALAGTVERMEAVRSLLTV